MVLYGGQYWAPYDWCSFQPECVAVGLNDVWQSADGASWEQCSSMRRGGVGHLSMAGLTSEAASTSSEAA